MADDGIGTKIGAENISQTLSGEPMIFTMPEPFRRVTLERQASFQKSVLTPPPVSVSAPVIPPPVQPGKMLKEKGTPLLKKKSKRLFWGMAILGAAALLAVLGTFFSPWKEIPVASLPTPSSSEEQKPTPKPVVSTKSTGEGSTSAPTTPKQPEPSFPEQIRPGRDTDGDGLTDVEETLYLSNFQLPDTDGDGFLDGNEVFHRYDPLRPSPATLFEAGKVLLVHLGTIGETFSPTAWSVQNASVGEKTPSTLTLAVPSGEAIVLHAEPADASLTLEAWWKATFPEKGKTDGLPAASLTKEGYPLLISKDQLTAFVLVRQANANFVVIFTYQAGGKMTADYFKTFQMIVNGFRLSAAVEAPIF